MNVERLSYAHIAGSGVTLAYQVDDKSYVRTFSHYPQIKFVHTGALRTERTARSDSALPSSRTDGQRDRRIRVHHRILRHGTCSTNAYKAIERLTSFTVHTLSDLRGVRRNSVDSRIRDGREGQRTDQQYQQRHERCRPGGISKRGASSVECSMEANHGSRAQVLSGKKLDPELRSAG